MQSRTPLKQDRTHREPQRRLWSRLIPDKIDNSNETAFHDRRVPAPGCRQGGLGTQPPNIVTAHDVAQEQNVSDTKPHLSYVLATLEPGAGSQPAAELGHRAHL